MLVSNPMDPAKRRDWTVAVATVGCAAIPLAAIVVAGVTGAFLLRRSHTAPVPPGPAELRETPSAQPPVPSASASATAPPPSPTPGPPLEDAPPPEDAGRAEDAAAAEDAGPSDDAPDPVAELFNINVPDPTRVDPADLVAQARKIAVSHDKHAVLVRISALNGVTAGTVDISGGDGVTYEFEWRYSDPSRPPGDDFVEGGLWLSARNGHFNLVDLPRAHTLAGSKSQRPDPGPDPRCSARNAWKAAVRSGVPENAVARLSYQAAFPAGPGRPYVWTFRIAGHQELRRDVNGATCARQM